MKNQPNWVKNAYKGTTVYWGATQSKIVGMLNELGIEQTRFTNMSDRFILEFVVRLEEKSIPRAVRIVIPLLTKGDDDAKIRNKELNIIHRILFYRLKSKFIDIGNGVAEFEKEFMADLVMPGNNGKTMGEVLLPQYREKLESKDSKPFQLGDGN